MLAPPRVPVPPAVRLAALAPSSRLGMDGTSPRDEDDRPHFRGSAAHPISVSGFEVGRSPLGVGTKGKRFHFTSATTTFLKRGLPRSSRFSACISTVGGSPYFCSRSMV